MGVDTVVVAVAVAVAVAAGVVAVVGVFEVLHHSYAMWREVLDSVNIVAVAADWTRRDWFVLATDSLSGVDVMNSLNKHCWINEMILWKMMAVVHLQYQAPVQTWIDYMDQNLEWTPLNHADHRMAECTEFILFLGGKKQRRCITIA